LEQFVSSVFVSADAITHPQLSDRKELRKSVMYVPPLRAPRATW
jgi:hypothetical protein